MRKKYFKFILPVLVVCVAVTSIVFYSISMNAATNQSYSWKNVATGGGGGFIPAIVFNTKEKDLIYARTDMGGAYRWDPSNGKWIQLLSWVGFDDWNWTGCESIATDPVDPDRLYLAVGTYTNEWTSANGAILRSNDRGKTFQRTDLPFKLGSNMPGRGPGERLVIDPNNNKILYLGARSGKGLWRSTDSGETWSKVSSFPNPGNYVQDSSQAYLADNPGVLWITFDPSTGTSGSATKTIYVGVADKSSSIYKSTDGGSTWSAVSGQPTGFIPHHGVLGSNGDLYITYSDTQGPYDGSKGVVYKYNTTSEKWTDISPVDVTSGDDYYGYGGLAVDAQNPNTIMVASLNSWWPDAIIYRSTDGGSTWSKIWDWTSYPSRSLHYNIDITNAPWLNFGNTDPVEPVPAIKLGWMIEGMAIDPFDSDRMFYGTGATIYGCTNLTNWDKGSKIDIKSMALGVEEASVQDLISPPEGANLYSALGDIGGFRHDDFTKSPSQMYSIPYAGTYNSIDYAELKPEFLVRAGKGETLSTAFSYNGGSSWFAGNKSIGGITGGGYIAAAADASCVVWAPKDGVVSYSKDNGNSWISSQGVPMNVQVRSDRANAKKFYAFSSGKFYISTDGGATFTQTSATGLPTNGTQQFKAMPGIEGDIWLCGDDGLYHSTDSGSSFTKLSNVDIADTIGFGKAASGKSYMALYTSAKIDGVRGIFRSDDAGSSWVRINDEQHQYGCTNQCITGDPRVYGRVYLGTNGFGIVYGDIAGTVTDAPTSTPANTATTKATSTTIATTTATVNPTSTNTSTPVATSDPTATKTSEPTATASKIATPTATDIKTATPTVTATKITTPTATITAVKTVTPTSTVTATVTATTTATVKVTPTVTSKATPTSTSGPGININYLVKNDWGNGAHISVTINNNTSSAIQDWTLSWNFANNEEVTNLWSGDFTQNGKNVVVKNSPWNSVIPSNGSVSFGFNLSYATTHAKPTAYTLNSAPLEAK